MYKACIFDLDGTLLNTIETLQYYGNRALSEFGYKGFDTETYKYMVGTGAVNLVRKMLLGNEITDEEIFNKIYLRYIELYDSDTLYKTTVYDGITQLIDALLEKGLKTAVISNKPHAATIDVIKAFFGNKFNAVYGAREGFPIKPDPSVPLSIAKELSVKPEECIYVGDTGVDMKTGKASGFFTVGVLWGFRKKEELLENGADTIIENPSEILRWL